MSYMISRGEINCIDEFINIIGLRCRDNIKTIITVLQDKNYKFCLNYGECELKSMDKVWKENSILANQIIEIIHKNYGNLGVLVEYWMKTIGNVNLIGYFENWTGLEYSDPLVVEFIYEDISDYFENELSENEEPWLLADYQLIFAPDIYHKANVSGGTGPSVNIPPFHWAGTVQCGFNGINFRDYLNTYFKNGGFGVDLKTKFQNDNINKIISEIQSQVKLI